MIAFQVKIGSVNPRWDDAEVTQHNSQDDAQDHVVEQLRANVEGTDPDAIDPQLVQDTKLVTERMQRLVELPYRSELGDQTYEPIYVEICEVEVEYDPPDDLADAADRAYEMAGDR